MFLYRFYINFFTSIIEKKIEDTSNKWVSTRLKIKNAKETIESEKTKEDKKLNASWIQNQIDNIAQLLYTTKYKLVNLQ